MQTWKGKGRRLRVWEALMSKEVWVMGSERKAGGKWQRAFKTMVRNTNFIPKGMGGHGKGLSKVRFIIDKCSLAARWRMVYGRKRRPAVRGGVMGAWLGCWCWKQRTHSNRACWCLEKWEGRKRGKVMTPPWFWLEQWNSVDSSAMFLIWGRLCRGAKKSTVLFGASKTRSSASQACPSWCERES